LLLRENLDLKDYIEEQGLNISFDLHNLRELYSPFSSEENEEVDDESNMDAE